MPLSLVDARPKAQAILQPGGPDDPAVLDLTDAVQPPCLVLTWGEPWLTPNGQAPMFEARLEVRAIAGRYEPGAGLNVLEDLIAYAVDRFGAQPDYGWRPVLVTAPRALEYGGVLYLAAQLVYAVPVTVGSDGEAPVWKGRRW